MSAKYTFPILALDNVFTDTMRQMFLIPFNGWENGHSDTL